MVLIAIIVVALVLGVLVYKAVVPEKNQDKEGEI